MVDISQKRLRRIISEGEASHAVMRAANDSKRRAKTRLTDARYGLERFDDGTHALDRNAKYEKVEKQRAALVDAVTRAEEALRYAEAHEEEAAERWQLTGTLASAARDFAREHNALPADQESH